MSILATSIQARNIQNNIGNLQNQLDRLQGQISSGKKSTVFSGYGVESRRLLEFHSTITTYGKFSSNITQTGLFLDAQVTALNQIDTIGKSVMGRITTLLNGTAPDPEIINQTVRTDISQVINLMNTKIQGRYIFGGRGVNDLNVPAGDTAPPVFGIDPAAPGYNGPPAANNFFQLMLDPTYGIVDVGSGSGGISPTEVMTRLNHIFDRRSTAGSGGTFPASAGNPYAQATWFNGDLGSTNAALTQEATLRAQISETISIDYNEVILDPDLADPLGAGPAAGSSGFEDVLKALTILGTVGRVGGGTTTNPQDEQDYIDVLYDALALLEDGMDKLRISVATLGEKQNFVDDTLKRNQQIEDYTVLTLATIEDVDVAKASTEFYQRRSQLEASYTIISDLKDLQLSRFI